MNNTKQTTKKTVIRAPLNRAGTYWIRVFAKFARKDNKKEEKFARENPGFRFWSTIAFNLKRAELGSLIGRA